MDSKKTVVAPFVRSPYNYDKESASDETGLKCLDPSLAQQNMRDETDINTIVKRFNITGELPTNFTMPQYRDFEEVIDYHTALNAVIKADDAFLELPGALRARFNNDLAVLIDFLSDENNRAEAIKLGLIPEPSLELSVQPKVEQTTSEGEASGT